LALFVGLAALFVPLPKTLLHAEEVLGVIVLAVTGLVLYLVLRREGLSEADAGSGRGVYRRLPRALAGGWARLARGIREIGLSRRFFLSLAVSALILIFQIIAFWLVMRAYGLPLSLWAGAVVLLIVHFGTAIPNAPSNVGSYQFFTVVALSMYGVDKTAATGFSIAVFFILTIPLWIIGLWAIGSTGMSLAAIRREIAALRATPSGGARP